MSRRSVAIGAAAALLILGLAVVGFLSIESWRGRPEDAAARAAAAFRGVGAVPIDGDGRAHLPSDPFAGATDLSGAAGGSMTSSTGSDAHLNPSRRSDGVSSTAATDVAEGESAPTEFLVVDLDFWGADLDAGTAAIRLRIIDADGEPISGVMVGASAKYMLLIWTDRSGVAEWARTAAGSYQVFVHLPDRPAIRSAQRISVRDGETVEISLRIPAFDSEIVGRVLDPSSRPLRDIQVVATPLSLPGVGARFVLDTDPKEMARTGADGSFRFEGLARIEHMVSTRDCAPYSIARTTALAGSGESVELILAKGHDLEVNGTVTDSTGKPVMGASVRSPTHGGPQVETDAKGRFHLVLVHSGGGVGLAVNRGGFVQAEAMIPSAEVKEGVELDVDFTLEPLGETATLKGVLRDLLGRPLDDLVVHLHSATFGTLHQGKTDAEGAYEIPGVSPAADYRLWVNPMQSFRDFQQGPVELLAGENRFDITLEPLETGRLSGILRDGSGNPVSRWTLWARSASAGANSVAITTDSSGRFSVEDVPCGSLTIETRASPHLSIRGIELKPEEPLEVDLVVGIGGGSLSGAVATSSGGPIAGAKVALTWSRTEGKVQSIAYREARTDADGRFVFGGLPSGRADLGVAATGFRNGRRTVDLGGAAEEIAISLDPTGQ